MSNVIAVDVRHAAPQEGIAGGTILGGMLIKPSGSDWVAHSVAGGSSDYVANCLMESDISTAFADGDLLPYMRLIAGDKVNALLTTNQTVVEGDNLTSNGDGYLKLAGTGVQNVGSDTNYVPITPLENKVVTVEFIDPSANSADLSVSITGNYIAVSLATDGSGVITSTPALIKAAIENASGYDSLVSVGTVSGTSAVTADKAILQADEVFGIAKEDVTTVASVSRILVMKGDA